MYAFGRDFDESFDELWCGQETARLDKDNRIGILFAIPSTFIDEYIFGIVIDNPEWIEGKEEETGIYPDDYFTLSMERPIYIQKPLRFLHQDEKELLNKYLDDHWQDLIKCMRETCIDNCFYHPKCIGCSKFRNKPIPDIHPDFTLLTEDDVKLNLVRYYTNEPIGWTRDRYKID